MNREQIIRMAREQGLPETETEGVFRVNTDDLGRMLAAEREACARVVGNVRSDWNTHTWNQAVEFCVKQILARGNQT